MTQKLKIMHLTSVHTRYDIRIFKKMLSSLSKHFQSYLVVADGLGNETVNNIQITDVGKSSGRLNRMTKTVNAIYDKAVALDACIYHMHDPELIPIGLKLKKLGKIVIFDAHEDLPKQLRSKPYLNTFTKWLLPLFFEKYEAYACKKFDAIVCATPSIRDKFLKINAHAHDINNFPILGELSNSSSWENKLNEICYVGGMAEIRGLRELVKSLEYLDNCRLNLVGEFSEVELERELKQTVGWGKVNELGFLDRAGVAEVMARSKAGIVTFHEVPNHVDAQPNKMFEYMSAKIPVIASNFPMWRDIIEGHKCGICVDPMDPRQIANAVKQILDNDDFAKEMSENGARSVVETFNWQNEEIKLIEMYKGLIS